MSFWDDTVGLLGQGIGGYFDVQKTAASKDSYIEGQLALQSMVGQAAQDRQHADTSTIEGVPDWALYAGAVLVGGLALVAVVKAVK